MGNSEVGHQNIGAGRVVDQEIVRINKGIATGSLSDSPALGRAGQCAGAGQCAALHGAGVGCRVHHARPSVRPAGRGWRRRRRKSVSARVHRCGVTPALSRARVLLSKPKPRWRNRYRSDSHRSQVATGRWTATIVGTGVQRAYDRLTGRTIERTFASASEAIQAQYDAPETEGTKGDESAVRLPWLTPRAIRSRRSRAGLGDFLPLRRPSCAS